MSAGIFSLTNSQSDLVVKTLEKDKPLDFSIDTLGECTVDSPLVGSSEFVDPKARIAYFQLLSDIEDYEKKFGNQIPAFEVAGPRKKIFFNPQTTTAAIVTCGGLCPGQNNVIRAITFTLNLYGVNNILGVPYGFQGLVPKYSHNFRILNGYSVSNIHTMGGTILGTSRGPQNPMEMVNFLQHNGINILFTIGGDGTQKGALALVEEIRRRNLKISVVGVPKTIDNDLNFVEKTFGFETAVEAAREAISRIHTEVACVENGIGIVRLMGRDSGYIAAQTALASMDVNVCLIPELDFDLHGKNGLFETITRRLNYKKHCVIAVAEGAGQKFFNDEVKLDASGNKKHGDIGQYLVKVISEFYANHPLKPVIKYIDPSYLIRSLPASANDGAFCIRLGQAAVHAAMAGKTGALMGYWSRIFTHVPISYAVSARKKIHPRSLFWQSVLEVTRQPKDMTNPDNPVK